MKVLIVDDSAVQRMVLAKMLGGIGHTVISAANGRIALELLDKQPDIIVCDITMPELDGYGVLKGLAQVGSTIPVVMASADIHPVTQDKCRSLGAAGFVAKPYSEHDICSAIARAMAYAGATVWTSPSA